MAKNVPGGSKEPKASMQAGPSEMPPREKGLSEKRSSETEPSEKRLPEKGPSEKAKLQVDFLGHPPGRSRVSIQVEPSEKGPPERESSKKWPPEKVSLASRSASLGNRDPSGSPAVCIVKEEECSSRSKSLVSPGPLDSKPLFPSGVPGIHIMSEVEPTAHSGPSEAKPLQQAEPPVTRDLLEMRPLQPAGLSVNHRPSELRPMEQLVVPLTRSPSQLRVVPHVMTPISRGTSEMRPMPQKGLPLSRTPSETRALLQASLQAQGTRPSKLIHFKPIESSHQGVFTLKHAIRFAKESCSSTVGLVMVCIILLTLVAIMNTQVSNISQRSKELKAVINLQVIILGEFLRDLQFGKEYNCSICEIPWVQWGDNCYLFRHRAMRWSWSRGFCLEEQSTLMVANGTKEMDFLKFESIKHFNRRKHSHFHKFWIGLKYDTDANQWMWTDGSAFDSTNYPELGKEGCAYLWNGSLRSQPCTQAAFILCKTKTLFG